MNASLFFCLVFGAWAVAVAIGDCRARRVPNALVVFGLGVALIASSMHAGPAHIGVLHSLAAGLLGGVALMPFFVMGVMGAGDVKVFAVLGAWCGLHALPTLWIIATLAAGADAAVALILMRVRKRATSAPGRLIFRTGARRGTPFAACLTLAALAWAVWRLWPLVIGSAR